MKLSATASTADPLGDRMKRQYEHRTRYFLPRRTYTIVRVDGKTFHTYTRGLGRPFDVTLMADMDAAATELCRQMQGAAFAFVQSDEISVLLTDFATNATDAWFDGNLQKVVSVAASIATATFNERRRHLDPSAYFDARAFTIPDPTEVGNYFVWRQQDATRNSIQMAASALYSHRELHGCDQNRMQELLHQRGVNWNDYPVGFKRGRIIEREEYTGPEDSSRSRWVTAAPPIFTQERRYLDARIPAYDGPSW